MGLFAREDRSTDSRPPSQPATPRSAPSAAAQSGITVVAATCHVEGVLSGSGDLLIEGRLSGEIAGTAAVTVAEGGSVEAMVHGRTVIIAGRVRGDVSASDKIELAPSADVEGNITAPRILIREGATFEGQVFMKQPEAKQQRPAEAVGGSQRDATGQQGASAAPAEARSATVSKAEPSSSGKAGKAR